MLRARSTHLSARRMPVHANLARAAISLTMTSRTASTRAAPPKDTATTATDAMDGAAEAIAMKAVGAMIARATVAARGTIPPRATAAGEIAAAPTAQAAAVTAMTSTTAAAATREMAAKELVRATT